MKYAVSLLIGALFLNFQLVEANVGDGNFMQEGELNTCLLDILPEPSSIIGGAVNVITGNYVECECDLYLPSSNPFTVQRCFNSGSKIRGSLCHGWDLNLPSEVRILETRGGEKKPHKAVVNDRGSRLLFHGKKQKNLKLDSKQLKYGVTNCASGFIGSQTNIRNKKLTRSILTNYNWELLEETERDSFTTSRQVKIITAMTIQIIGLLKIFCPIVVL